MTQAFDFIEQEFTGLEGVFPVVFCHGSPSSRLAAVDLVSRVVERGGRRDFEGES